MFTIASPPDMSLDVNQQLALAGSLVPDYSRLLVVF